MTTSEQPWRAGFAERSEGEFRLRLEELPAAADTIDADGPDRR